jgi:hypothetical protein
MLDHESLRRLAEKALIDAQHLEDTAARLRAEAAGAVPAEGATALEMFAGSLQANARSVRITAARLEVLAGKGAAHASA